MFPHRNQEGYPKSTVGTEAAASVQLLVALSGIINEVYRVAYFGGQFEGWTSTTGDRSVTVRSWLGSREVTLASSDDGVWDYIETIYNENKEDPGLEHTFTRRTFIHPVSGRAGKAIIELYDRTKNAAEGQITHKQEFDIPAITAEQATHFIATLDDISAHRALSHAG